MKKYDQRFYTSLDRTMKVKRKNYKQYSNGSSLILSTKERPCAHIGHTQRGTSYKHTQSERLAIEKQNFETCKSYSSKL